MGRRDFGSLGRPGLFRLFLAGARTLQEQVVEASLRVLGPEHPYTLTAMNNLAQTLQAQGEMAGARTLQEQVPEAMTRLLGKEHPNTLASMLNLASLYYTQNQYAKAEPLYRQVLRILAEFGHRTGREHPHSRTAINNYVVLLSAMGWSEAEILARLRSAIESEADELA
jgi:tetratricopeptide (TPR) repeat protein